MTIRISTGLRAALLSDYGLKAMMNYGVIAIYSGAQPSSASSAPTGTLLGHVTQNGTAFQPNTTTGGLQVDLLTTGGLGMVGTWRLKGVATGDVGWWRWKWNAVDDDSDSIYFPRMDGAYNESLTLAAGTITAATNVVIDDFYVNIME